MPNRIIKESIRDSKTISSLTDFEFRLWVCLITFVDDYGRGTADPELIKGHIFPRRPKVSCKDIKEAMLNLSYKGCIVLYEVDHEVYFFFPKWANHQRIQTKKSKYPDPEDGFVVPPSSTVNHRESPSESNPIQSESNPNTNTNSVREPHTEKNKIPPTLEEVTAYCKERNNNVNPEAYMDYYEARGWYLSNGKKMVDWKATVRTWERNNFDNDKKEKIGPNGIALGNVPKEDYLPIY